MNLLTRLFYYFFLFVMTTVVFTPSLNGIVDSISLNATSVSFTINQAIAGSDLTSATAATTYNVETVLTGVRKVTGLLTSAMPTGIALSANLAAPSGAVSNGSLILTTTAQTFVTNISAGLGVSNLSLNYTFSATVQAPIGSGTNVVVYTIGP